MNTQVYFSSSKFPPYEGEEDAVNPGLWGKRLAEYLVEMLKDSAFSTAEPFSEDWGWYLPLQVGDTKMGLCCGHQADGEDSFMIFTDPIQPVVRKLFKKIDYTNQLEQVTAELDRILKTDGDISDIQWASE